MNPTLSRRTVAKWIAVLAITPFLAWWCGSAAQVRVEGRNAHAHLSDVSDAITLGEYFTTTSSDSPAHQVAAKATTAIIFRILGASTPGPNSKKRLESLEAQLRARYY